METNIFNQQSTLKEDSSAKAGDFFRYLTSNRFLEIKKVTRNSWYSEGINHLFLIHEFGFAETFVKRIQTLLRNLRNR